MSVAGSTVSIRPNRWSTSFPVQPAIPEPSPSRLASPTRDGPAVAPESLTSPTGMTDTSFLTAVAAQERKVLELREELQRAEADLNKLKKQWAQHEANKKRNDARRITKLQPLQTSTPSPETREDDADGSSAWMQQEMDRRKALMSGGRSSNRTVFSGSRHTRTLSLLSPAQDERPKSFARRPLPVRRDSLAKRSLDSERASHQRPSIIARASTTPDLTVEIAESADPGEDLPDNLDRAQIQSQLDSEALIKHGKKMASDFKDGLWTFLEDLRQATVGDEATQHETVLPGTHSTAPVLPRRQSAVQTPLNSRTHLQPGAGKNKDRTAKTPSPAREHAKSATRGALPDLADPSFWDEQGVSTPSTTHQATKKSPGTSRGHVKHVGKTASIASTSASADAWDTWPDDPIASPKQSDEGSRSSSAASETGTLPSTVSASNSGHASPRTSGEGKKEPIPWPALSKLGPGTLKRTASRLMHEWERSLTPSPGQEFTGQEDYLGFAAEAAATAGRTGKKD